jgi:hypothetical protein
VAANVTRPKACFNGVASGGEDLESRHIKRPSARRSWEREREATIGGELEQRVLQLDHLDRDAERDTPQKSTWRTGPAIGLAIVGDAVERPVGHLDVAVSNDQGGACRGATTGVERGQQPYDRPTLVEPFVLEALEVHPLCEFTRPRSVPQDVQQFSTPHRALPPRGNVTTNSGVVASQRFPQQQ